MTNAEKYKTAHERAMAYNAFCAKRSVCQECPLLMRQDWTMNECRYAWLELEAEESEVAK